MDRIQLRRDTSARWAEVNPTLLEGEVGYEIDTKFRKIGDGVNRWNDLEYLKAENIVQETGNSENAVMSQKVVTEKLTKLVSDVDIFSICVEKSRNLVVGRIKNCSISAKGVLMENADYDMYYAQVTADSTYRLISDSGFVGSFYEQLPKLSSSSYNNSRIVDTSSIVTAPISGYIAFRVASGYRYAQCTLGEEVNEYMPPLEWLIAENSISYDKLSKIYTPLVSTTQANESSKKDIEFLNQFIRSLYIDVNELPEDISYNDDGTPSLFFRQLYNTEGLKRIWFNYKKSDGSFSNCLPLNLQNEESPFLLQNGKSYAIVDWQVLEAYNMTGEQPIYEGKDKYPINWRRVQIYRELSVQEELSKVESEIKGVDERQKTILDNIEQIGEVVSIPNNNNYTTWNEANLIIERLYIENKEEAKKNNLRLSQILFNYNKVYGFNFGDSESSFGAIQIQKYWQPSQVVLKDELVVQTEKYGTVKVKYDFTKYDWGSDTQIFPSETGEILDIAYDEKEYDKPIDTQIKGLSSYSLFTIGDSMCQSGTWQNVVSEKTGIKFDQNLNANPSHPTSIGGTTSMMDNPSSTYFRALNLVKHGGIEGKGENAVILLENINDEGFVFDSSARSFRMEDSVIVNELTESELNNVPTEKRTLNTVVKLIKKASGKILTINTRPTVEGDVKLVVGWSGPGYSDYYIHVTPSDSIADIVSKITEINYKSVYDNEYGGESVSFTSGDSSRMVRVEFYDEGNTGMTCSLAESSEIQYEQYYWFDSYDIAEWSNPAKWIVPSVS